MAWLLLGWQAPASQLTTKMTTEICATTLPDVNTPGYLEGDLDFEWRLARLAGILRGRKTVARVCLAAKKRLFPSTMLRRRSQNFFLPAPFATRDKL